METQSGGPQEDISDAGDTSVGKYPKGAGVTLAAVDKSERYYFRNPTGGLSSIPAVSADQARKLLADTVRGFAPEDFEEVDGFDAKPWDYPKHDNSDRTVNEYDIWMLKCGMRAGRQPIHPRKNPTETTLQTLLDEWEDPADIPLSKRTALQQADGVGPTRASRVVGAAVASELITRPVRGDE